MSAARHSNLDTKTKALAAMVCLGDLAGEVVTFFGGVANSAGSVVRFLCECGWAVFAFPLGWLGMITADVPAPGKGVGLRHACFWVGVTMNALLWAWIAHRVARAVRAEAQHGGFHAPSVSLRIAEVRQNHAAAAHSRWKPPRARNALVGAAKQAIRGCGYFFRAGRGRQDPCEQEEPKV